MTEEQATKLVEMVQHYDKLETMSTIFSGILIGVAIAILFYFCYKYQKIKKMHNEWKSTLTDEEIKKIERDKRYYN